MVDMVISDIMMPEMDGFALADSIRQLDKGHSHSFYDGA